MSGHEEEGVHLDFRGIDAPMNNRSFDGDPNNGSRGKLNSEQLAERLKLHALRSSLGKPSHKDIVAHWYKEYEITINVRSEREWSDTHEDEILDKMQQMERDGEIEVVHTSNAALTNTLAHGAKKKVSILEKSHRELNKTLNSLDSMRDVFKAVGLTKEQFFDLDADERVAKQKDIDFILKLRKANLNEVKEISVMSVDHAKGLKEFIALAKEINGSDAILDKKMKDALRMEKQRKSLEKADKSKVVVIDPLMEIDESDRES